MSEHFGSKLTGGHSPRFNAWMAKEEGRTGDNNRALAYMMKAQHVFPKGEDASDHEIRDALELYFSHMFIRTELSRDGARSVNSG